MARLGVDGQWKRALLMFDFCSIECNLNDN